MVNPQKQAPMTSREWFVLGIRLFGLWMLTRGVAYLASFTDLTLHYSDTSRGTNPNSYLLYAAFDFAVAGYFLLGARHFAGICDRIHQSDEQEREDEDIG
jgi:hypothetical protein